MLNESILQVDRVCKILIKHLQTDLNWFKLKSEITDVSRFWVITQYCLIVKTLTSSKYAVKSRNFRQGLQMTFVAYSFIRLQSLQPFHFILSGFCAKATHILRYMIAVAATRPPRFVTVSPSSLWGNKMSTILHILLALIACQSVTIFWCIYFLNFSYLVFWVKFVSLCHTIVTA